MDIKTITCHNVANYGASLQALALQTYIEELGHKVQIIDYVPSYLKAYNVWRVPRTSRLYKLSRYSSFISVVYAFKMYVSTYSTRKRLKSFQLFNKRYLHLTERYNSYNQLVDNPPKADIYIAGSDQIWSTFLMNGRDPAFYCAFGDINTKRFSYAASFGFPELYGYKNFVKAMLSLFDKVSVREDTGLKIVKSLNCDAIQVVDPVLLLSKNKWMELLSINKRIIPSKYLLVYDIFQTDERLKNFSIKLAKKLDLKIVAINDIRETSYADININDGGPREFVNLIANADFVLADSFHATAFSVIFQKPFYIFYTKQNISRIEDFLRSLNLLDRLNPRCEIDSSINWDNCEYFLDEKIRFSQNFLNDNLR